MDLFLRGRAGGERRGEKGEKMGGTGRPPKVLLK